MSVELNQFRELREKIAKEIVKYDRDCAMAVIGDLLAKICCVGQEADTVCAALDDLELVNKWVADGIRQHFGKWRSIAEGSQNEAAET